MVNILMMKKNREEIVIPKKKLRRNLRDETKKRMERRMRSRRVKTITPGNQTQGMVPMVQLRN